jgi:adenylate cyclase
MRCPMCGTEGIPGKKFCAACGSPLSNRYPQCNSDNATGAKFCADCGTALVGHAPSAATSPSPAASTAPNIRVTPESSSSETLDGERKTVTALFADIKGSTELMEDLDPGKRQARLSTPRSS